MGTLSREHEKRALKNLSIFDTGCFSCELGHMFEDPIMEQGYTVYGWCDMGTGSKYEIYVPEAACTFRRKKILSKLPEGWSYITRSTTAPNGYRWASNNKSRFKPGYKNALVKEDGTDVCYQNRPPLLVEVKEETK